MRTWTIAFLMGIAVAQQCSQTPNPAWLLLLPACLLAFVRANYWLRSLFVFILGFLWLFTTALLFSHHSFPQEFEGQELLLEGTIASIPKISSRSSRFDFTTQLDNKPYKFRLSWYKKHFRPPQAGERWRLLVKLKRPHGVMNPGGFDYERSLYRHGVSATGYVRSNDINERIITTDLILAPSVWVAKLRQSISNALRKELKGKQHQGLIEALAIGNRDKITASEWDILTRTGTIHLVAISGLHIGLVAGLVFFIIRFVVGRSKFLMRQLPVQIPAAAFAIMAAFFYAMLAGFSIPTQRAFLMVYVVMISLMQRRTIRSSNVIALSLLLILIFDPMSILDAGFWLSFGAVAVILFAVTGRLRAPASIFSWGKIQLVIAIGMLPMTLMFFQRISLSAPIANLFAVPLVSFVTVPATLLGAVTLDLSTELSGLLLHVATESLNILWFLLEWLNAQPWSIIETHVPVAWTLIPAAIGAVWLLMPRGFPTRWMAVTLFLPVILVTPQKPEIGELRLSLIDVGQGLSVFIQTRNHSLVFDAGPRYSESFDAGKNIVIPFIKSQGLLSLDALIVSHGDNDHSGGAKAILNQLNVNRVYTGANTKRWQHETAVACQAGDEWQWDGVSFKFLHPIKEQGMGGNNRSCVLQVSIGTHSILLPGDIETKAENELVARFKDQLKSDLLIAPHHGSKTSSSPVFIEHVAPQMVFVANGYRNRYRFPHQSVTQRYTDSEIAWFETAKLGAISVTMTAEGLAKPVFWRDKLLRYWHTR
ncbi:MAG: DNA internalization-related competence protein ComEC/Rec2 [Sulfuriflexus sp.]|nr:DNA internalization-related competence protein ComEC/Rec2 [Sulfuriflexus sp.]